MSRARPNTMNEVVAAVVAAAAEDAAPVWQPDDRLEHDPGPPADASAFGPAVPLSVPPDDAHANSYQHEGDPGVTVEGPVTWVTGANGRRISIVDTDEGVYLGGVRIEDRAHLGQLASVLNALYQRRWFR